MLPQFHPQQLLEWMNLGRIRLVQATLAHLVRSLFSQGNHHREDLLQFLIKEEEKKEIEKEEKEKKRQRKEEGEGHKQENVALVVEEENEGIDDETKKDSCTASNIPLPDMEISPLPLYVLTALDSLKIDKPKAPKNGRLVFFRHL